MTSIVERPLHSPPLFITLSTGVVDEASFLADFNSSIIINGSISDLGNTDVANIMVWSSSLGGTIVHVGESMVRVNDTHFRYSQGARGRPVLLRFDSGQRGSACFVFLPIQDSVQYYTGGGCSQHALALCLVVLTSVAVVGFGLVRTCRALKYPFRGERSVYWGLRGY